MAVTLTDYIELRKQADGDEPWGANYRLDLDDIDLYIGQNGIIDPDTNPDSAGDTGIVECFFIGQRYFNSVTLITWIGVFVGAGETDPGGGPIPGAARWRQLGVLEIGAIGDASVKWGKAQYTEWQALALGVFAPGQTELDFALGNYYKLDLTNDTEIVPTNFGGSSFLGGNGGMSLILEVYQNGGDNELTFSSDFYWPSGVTPDVTPTHGKVDYFQFIRASNATIRGTYIFDYTLA